MVSDIPRNKRWSEVSGSANADTAYHKWLKDTPEAYEYVCTCKRPRDDDDEDDDEAEGSENGENAPFECDGGKKCLCGKPAVDHPDHPWVFTKAAMRRMNTYRIMVDLRDPDSFSMYTFNDHAGYGGIEVAQNVLLDFHEASGNWKEQWAVCEALALMLTCNALGPILMIDGPDLLQDTIILLEHMFLTTLAELEKQGALDANSEIRNLGLIMGLIASEANIMRSEGIISVDTKSKKKSYHGENFVPYLLAYARKHNISMRGPSNLDDIIAEAEEEAEEKDVTLPTAPKDPWKWATAFKAYERGNMVSPFSRSTRTKIGGDSLDITTYTTQERKKASFDKKDPFNAEMIQALKDGEVLQLA